MSHGNGFSTKGASTLLIATFIFGFVSGSLFLLFHEQYVASTRTPTQTTETFSVIAHAQGGCLRAGCGSYRIEADGAYTYINSENIKKEGKLSQNDFQALKTQLAGTDFVTLGRTTFNGVCPSVYDGLSFQYEIMNQGTRYTFDSCKQDIGGNAFFQTLETYFGTLDKNT